MDAPGRSPWLRTLAFGLAGGLLLIGAMHVFGVVGSSEVIPPVRVEHVFPPRISDATFDLSHEFEVRNPSRRTVRILQKRVSCGCVTAELGKTVLGPGEATRLRMGIAVPQGETAHRSSVELRTDLRQQPSWLYSISVDWYRPVVATPEMLSFGQVRPGAELRRSFQVEVHRVGSDGDVAPPALHVSNPSGALRAVQKGPPRLWKLAGGIERWTFPLELQGESGQEHGEHREEIRMVPKAEQDEPFLETFDQHASLTMPIVWSVQGPISAEPSRVFFGNVWEQTEPVVRRVVLRADDGRAFQVVRLINTSSPHVRAALVSPWDTEAAKGTPVPPRTVGGQTPLAARERTEIDIILDPVFDGRFLTATLTLGTDHPDCPAVEIGLSAFRIRSKSPLATKKEEVVR